MKQMPLQRVIRQCDMVGKSPGIRRALEMAAITAKVDSTVLITGESGHGKEVIANAIHRVISRSQGPLIKVNGGAIAGNLLESELFGCDSEAFNGARKQGKPGSSRLPRMAPFSRMRSETLHSALRQSC